MFVLKGAGHFCDPKQKFEISQKSELLLMLKLVKHIYFEWTFFKQIFSFKENKKDEKSNLVSPTYTWLIFRTNLNKCMYLQK